MKNVIIVLLLFVAMGVADAVSAQSDELKRELKEYLYDVPGDDLRIGKFSVKKIWTDDGEKLVKIRTSGFFGGIPFRKENVDTIKAGLREIVQGEYPNWGVEVYVEKKKIEELIPNCYLENKDEARQFVGAKQRDGNVVRSGMMYDGGLTGRNVALWHSHGLYYRQQEDRWVWQRARLFTTVEDRFSPSFVIPYLLPMLENAGANVFLPRERDCQENEVIVDNDEWSGYRYSRRGGEGNASEYREHSLKKKIKGKRKKNVFEEYTFSNGSKPGCAVWREEYRGWENPFDEGTYRRLVAQDSASAWVDYVPDVPEDGDYSVWVGYVTDEKSVEDARYTVYHSDGKAEFVVNQTMAGGTWVYLGTFHFKEGVNKETGRVELSNESGEEGYVVADAVRFGGGKGNVARTMATEADLEKYKEKYPERDKTKLKRCYAKEEYELSGASRFFEGSRYWMQWAGVPDSVYSIMMGLDDYTDDYGGRGPWVNWLNQGSKYAPKEKGLGVPIDVALAFHTNAGISEDETIGTLGIYRSILDTETKKDVFPSGVTRMVSRDLTDMVMSSVCDDIRRTCGKNWMRDGMWDRGYSECRRPEVPSLILELMSHQNLNDMKLGLDPRFKFIASRAVYKGMLRFVYEAYGLGNPVIQPLPVQQFSAVLVGKDSVQLSWKAVEDKLEKTAVPDGYVVYASRNGGWDEGVGVKGDSLKMKIENDVVYRYKVVAVNAGGKSMDSEVLSVCGVSDAKGEVMIVNGFDRVGAPEAFYGDENTAGFSQEMGDHGVPHGVDLQYCGAQYEFDRRSKWKSDDDPGWGACRSDYDTKLVVGNSFNYPYMHGKSIANAGYSFSSSSKGAVEEGRVDLKKYAIVDLILGEQKRVESVDSNYNCDTRTYSVKMREVLSEYASGGGNLLVSGAYVASGATSEEGRKFINEVLKIDYSTHSASVGGEIKSVYSPLINIKGTCSYSNALNDSIYCVEAPDAIVPIKGVSSQTMRFSDNNKGVGVAHKGDWNTFVMSVPFEAVLGEEKRDKLMAVMLQFLAIGD